MDPVADANQHGAGLEVRHHTELAVPMVDHEMVAGIATFRVLGRIESGIAVFRIRLIGAIGAGADDAAFSRGDQGATPAGVVLALATATRDVDTVAVIEPHTVKGELTATILWPPLVTPAWVMMPLPLKG